MSLSQSFKDSVQTLVNRWQNLVDKLNPGATEEQLRSLQSAVGLFLPEDFRYLYSVVNGMPSHWDVTRMFVLWPIEMIIRKGTKKTKTEDGRKFTAVTFGDYLIDSYRYSLVLDDDGNCDIRVDCREDSPLCASIEEFVDLYVRDPEKIWLL